MVLDDLKSVTLKVNDRNHELFEAHKIWSEFDIEYDTSGVLGMKVNDKTKPVTVYTVGWTLHGYVCSRNGLAGKFATWCVHCKR